MINSELSNKSSFGQIIKEKRKELKLTLKDLADYCDISINYMSMIERDVKTPSDSLVVKIAHILNMDEYILFVFLEKLHPTIRQNVGKIISENEGLKKILVELFVKVTDEKMRGVLYEELNNTYNQYLKRNKI